MRRLGTASSFVLLTVLACNGTETQNPEHTNGALVGFGNSGCKKETLDHASRRTQAVTTADAGVISYGEEVEGLKCFAWRSTGSDSVKISLVNFEGACGAEWKGHAALDASGALTLGIINPQCQIANCGICIYDWSFEVRGIALGTNLPLAVSIDTCPGEQPIKTTNVELPLATQPDGILCRYADFSALGWQAMALGTCGDVGMPCTGTNMCSNSDGSTAHGCESGLTCTDNGNADEMICATSCTIDADCGVTGVKSCQQGLCRPKAAW